VFVTGSVTTNYKSTSQQIGTPARNYLSSQGMSWQTHSNIFSAVASLTGRMTYLNGAFVPYVKNADYITSTDNQSYPMTFADADFYMATRGGGDAFAEAEIASVRIYARALTAEEVAHNYLADVERFIVDKTPIV
jgi:hypothetical protein